MADPGSGSSNQVLNNLTVITGGARSGKSYFAEKQARALSRPVCYIATMEEVAGDAESLQRIDKHRSRRPPEWKTIVAPFAADRTILEMADSFEVCIFDCLSLYISNLLLREDARQSSNNEIETLVDQSCINLLKAVENRTDINFFLVTNEVGWGIVPENRLARIYRDLLGLSNQALARSAREVYLCVAGIPVVIKS